MFVWQYCNKIIGTYFEKCGKVAALSSDYKMICVDEYCQTRDKTSTCDTYSELSRLCASDGPGTFEFWRSDSDVACETQSCPEQHIYKECGPSNPATCSNVAPFQDSECVSGCTCPEDYLLDDIREKGKCVLKAECPCESNGKVYQAGEVREEVLFVEGSSFTTFDGVKYNHPGNCHFLAIHSVPVDKYIFNSDGTVTNDKIGNQGYYYSGLCGSYNNKAEDDFMSSQNILEKTSQAFANSWEMMSCPKGNPSSCISIEKGKFAERHCGILLDSSGPFASCHPIVNPKPYHEVCEALTLTALVEKYFTDIDKSISCRSLSERDRSCDVEDVPVDGCTCPDEMYQNNEGNCVLKSQCDCYINDEVMKPGKLIHIDDNKWYGDYMYTYYDTEIKRLHCFQRNGLLPNWARNIDSGQIITKNLDLVPEELKNFDCFVMAEEAMIPTVWGKENLPCKRGCFCPEGMVRNSKGICVFPDDCPCSFGGREYDEGSVTPVGCNECTCIKGSWSCTQNECQTICHIYGEGHVRTFDGKSYSFDGLCQYSFLEGKVCGLCGNNNGDLKDDFTTRYTSVASGALEFGNSWKTSQECSDTVAQTFPCDSNPYCKAWAVRKCEILRDSTFRDCHNKVALL
ncbi:Mucin-19 [Saguinus oedipus]|uniref:Mucin-19 n=1 Tax=Saguinus oedipus TaxID=9490 RepID=A0ABQ9UXA9_SAGOE|nr:Mucin-19 [Saguinus oedipus]